MNRLANCHNEFQGLYKRVLCVCSAGLLRSPTAALVLSQPPFNFNTRAAGLTENFALIIVDDVLLKWADEIVCMSTSQVAILQSLLKDQKKSIICLDISDNFAYRDPPLMDLIKTQYIKMTNFVE